MHSVSVIIAAYNQEKELALSLPRLMAQDYRGTVEYLVCDDGSGPSTLAFIRKWQKEGDIRYIWQPDIGFRLARSRNNGLCCATGDIIIFVDADLVVARDFISRHVAAHRAFPSLVCGGRKRVFERDLDGFPKEQTIDRILASPELLERQRSDDWFQQKYARTPSPWVACIGANFSVGRTLPDVFFDEKFEGWGAEDQEFACRLWKRYGYNIIIETAISGIQLERGSPENFTTMRPRTHEQITRYLRNLIHFVDSFPDVDTSPVCNGLGFYAYDPSGDEWRLADEPRFEQAHIIGLFSSAREWLARRPMPSVQPIAGSWIAKL